MVVINDVKYACEACIKGHRSSSCGHTNRPLFEIKKKGRPITQCDHCRQLRKTKQVHVKCSCGGEPADLDEKTVSHGKAKRKLPTSAVFPHGLDGIAARTSSSSSSTSQSKPHSVSSCGCELTGECGCATPVSKRRPSAPSPPSPTSRPPGVSSCCSKANAEPAPVIDITPTTYITQTYDSAPQVLDFILPPPAASVGGFNIPPTTPDLTWPPGIGVGICSCGTSCTCPGCVEHSDPSTALSYAENCPYSCSTCNDCNGVGFAPPPALSPITSQVTEWTALPGWPTTSLPPAASAEASSRSECCGGSCKCGLQASSCQCETSCCGCCFGCQCSDSEDSLDDIAPHLGFAISGERAGCGSGDKQGCNKDAGKDVRNKKRRKVEHGELKSGAYRTNTNGPDTHTVMRGL